MASSEVLRTQHSKRYLALLQQGFGKCAVLEHACMRLDNAGKIKNTYSTNCIVLDQYQKFGTSNLY